MKPKHIKGTTIIEFKPRQGLGVKTQPRIDSHKVTKKETNEPRNK